MDNDASKPRQTLMQLFPDPTAKILTCWIFKPFYIVQKSMIKCFVDRAKGVFDVCVVNHPPPFRVNTALHVDLNSE